MQTELTYPGVRIVEVPSGVRTITGVATAITAFIGRTRRGPVDKPVRVQSFAEYSAIFGGLWRPSTMGYAVSHFFQHGGGDALIVRVYKGDTKLGTATIKLSNMDLEAISPGVWGAALRAEVDHETRDKTDLLLFNLTIEELDRPSSPPPSEFNVVAKEIFRNVSVDPQSPRFVDKVLKEGSALVKVRKSAPATGSPANSNGKVAADGTPSDGDPITDSEIEGDSTKRSGIHALEEADLFNLLCIPPLTPEDDVANQTWATAARYCKERRAMLIVDPESAWTSDPTTTISKAEKGLKEVRSFISNDKAPNAVAFFPRLRMPDPLSEGRLADFAPCGAVAGIMARTDAQRGVWKAPAGVEASFSGVQGLTYTMTDAQNGVLNPIGLNCLRSFPVAGNLVWGARTMAGDDQLASEWKYLPVRRFALFLEESLFRGTQWVVFEPNDEPLWAQIRLNIGAFMQNLFRQGAFQGRSPREAYIVKCDRETTTQNDINLGIVNILVGFAPLKPAEFVVIRIQQMAGQIDT